MGRFIDTSFDFRTDTPPGRDPDKYSRTLQRYHQLLWSKYLPTGKLLELSVPQVGGYLYHLSDLGEFHLSSDGMIPSYATTKRMQSIGSTQHSNVSVVCRCRIASKGNCITGMVNDHKRRWIVSGCHQIAGQSSEGKQWRHRLYVEAANRCDQRLCTEPMEKWHHHQIAEWQSDVAAGRDELVFQFIPQAWL